MLIFILVNDQFTEAKTVASDKLKTSRAMLEEIDDELRTTFQEMQEVSCLGILLDPLNLLMSTLCMIEWCDRST